MTDFSRIAPRHEAIDQRLTEWARWVKVTPRMMAMQPMFRYARSNARQWEIDPPIHIEINTIAAHEVEKAVAALPEKHRTATRWYYVHPFIPVHVVRRELGLTKDALGKMIEDSRDILKNTLKA
ncbi:MAG: hypothetical protein WC829_15375 [Hyphomicrobium sp.]|jgi:hypothetical protein